MGEIPLSQTQRLAFADRSVVIAIIFSTHYLAPAIPVDLTEVIRFRLPFHLEEGRHLTRLDL